MTQAELIGQIANTIGKLKVLELSRILKEQQFALRDLIDITFHTNKAVAFRAAWLLENVFLKDAESYLPDLYYMISRFKEVKHQGCMRHYAKITMHITDAKALSSIQLKLKEINLEPVVEQLFDWMINPGTKVAVKIFAGYALFNLKDTFPWVKEELGNQMQFLMRNGSAAIQSGGKKILKEL
ncbi:hypothetical protein [Mucilaginibacter sp. FT3.2]|uniref:hypothetical protein n=1 Tax=Mucilaginibacter sp. FT3.2 TaxID=2723090 RepID=UPI00161DA6F6|nr:hypothetical protein [Mucilaginibacter sp. FT3.2]MBB6230264.1 hypothetical protein [Mucilaginibacter sp. FT3.2]